MGEHWYGVTVEGAVVPVYSITAKSSGKPRGVRITDVRKTDKYGMNVYFEGQLHRVDRLLPSVTTITNILAKPGLERWKLNKALEAAFETPAKVGQTFFQYAKQVQDDAYSTTSDAASFGTRVHKALEDALKADGLDSLSKQPMELRPFIEPALKYIAKEGYYDFQNEVALANPTLGYAGLADCVCKSRSGKTILIDFKTKRTVPDKPIFLSDEYKMQLAAYGHIVCKGDWDSLEAYNIYISSSEVGRVEIVENTGLEQAYKAFGGLVEAFKYVRKL